MYRKKEWIILGILLFFIVVWTGLSYLNKKEIQTSNEQIVQQDPLVIQIKGEVVHPLELTYIKPVSYGVLFLRIKNSFNEYSDISTFDLKEMILESKTIFIPTYDIGNMFSPSERICINQASLDDLKKLPQIGDKRAQKILDYVTLNGKIKTWEIFFKIVSVPENVKDEIKSQAFL